MSWPDVDAGSSRERTAQVVVFSAQQGRGLSFRQTATGIFTTAIQHRKLILRLAKREILARYKGSLLGVLWAILNPLLLLAVYTFVFSVVFHMRWGADAGGSTGEFALLLFSGLILFNILAECLIRAPGLMLENVSYIKKVLFPLEVLPYVQMAVALFGAATSLVIMAVFYPFVFGLPPVTVLLAPLVMVPLILLVMGLSWFLASVGVFLRDVRQIIGIFVTVTMFMSPIFYPAEAVPAGYRPLLQLGPLAIPLEAFKQTLFWGKMPDWRWLAIYGAGSFLVAMAGFWWFMRTRKAFADVV